MPSWPSELPAERGVTFITNIEEWRRRTGIPPAYVSATWNATFGGVFCPVRVPYPMYVDTLWALNGAAVSGNGSMGLLAPYPTGLEPMARTLIGVYVARSAIIPQAVINTWQPYPIAEVAIARGEYFVAFALDNNVSEVLQLYVPVGSGSGSREGSYMAGVALANGPVFPVNIQTGGMAGSNIAVPIVGMSGRAYRA